MPQQIQQQDRLIQADTLAAEFTTTLQGSLLLQLNLAATRSLWTKNQTCRWEQRNKARMLRSRHSRECAWIT